MSRRLASTVAALRLFRGFAALSLIASASALSAATLTVTNTNDNLAGSLRQAIQDANPGDTIVFNIPTNDPQHNASTQTWSISLVSGPLTIAKSLNIDAGMQRIVLQWAGQQTASNGQILVITSGTIVISNLTISNGRNVAVRNAGNLTFSGCTLTANQAETAAVLSNTGTATLVNCTVANNQTGTLS